MSEAKDSGFIASEDEEEDDEKGILTVQEILHKLLNCDRDANVSVAFKNSDPFAVVGLDQDEETGEVVLKAS